MNTSSPGLIPFWISQQILADVLLREAVASISVCFHLRRRGEVGGNMRGTPARGPLKPLDGSEEFPEQQKAPSSDGGAEI